MLDEPKNPAETTGNRYKIEILMSRTQKLKELVAASLILKTLNDNPYISVCVIIGRKDNQTAPLKQITLYISTFSVSEQVGRRQ